MPRNLFSENQRPVRFQPLEKRLLFSATPAGAADAPNEAAAPEDVSASDSVGGPVSSDQPSVADLEAQAAGAESLDSELTAVSAGEEGAAVPPSAPANVAAAATAESQVAQAPAETALNATQTPGDTPAAAGEASALASPLDVSLLAVVTDAPAVPTVTVNAPAFAMISEPFSYSITFDNTGTEPGYGPFIDERLAPGLDASGPPTLFGSPVPVVTTVDNSTGTAAVTFVHPYTGETITVNPGEEYRVFELPFGSVVPDQPAFDLQFSAITDKTEGAQVGVPLEIDARGGFRFGLDPVENPTTDPPIVSFENTDTVTPTVLEVSKVVIAPESETATGPNFPRTFEITLDVANGETISGLNITDVMPDNLRYIPGSLAVTGGGAFTTISEPDVPTAIDPADRTLELTFASVTGTLSDSDIVVQYQVFVPEFDAAGDPVIDPVTGQSMPSTNGVDGFATYDPDGPAGPLPPSTISDTVAAPALLPNTATLIDKSLATQKEVALFNDTGVAGLGPLDTLQYTINLQVSDFFEFDNLLVIDLIGDGQHFDTSFTPTLSFSENGVTTNGTFTLGSAPGGNFTFDRNLQTGITTANFNVSATMLALGADSLLTGDLARDSTLTSGTILTITYHTVIETAYIGPTPEDPSIGAGDSVGNNVQAGGQVVQDNGTPGGNVTDNSSSSVTIAPVAFEKTVYAINDNPSATSAFGPGDHVTFQFISTGARPGGKVDNLSLTDFLPLPKFEASEVQTLTLVFVPDTELYQPAPFNPGEVVIVFDSDFYQPTSGTDPNKETVDPVLSVDVASNSFTIAVGDVDPPESAATSRTITYATVTATDSPAADGLQLTNEMVLQATNSSGETAQLVDTAQVTVKEPVVDIYKGVVGFETIGLALGGVTFTAPNAASSFSGTVNATAKAQAIDASNLTANQVDGQDEVRFAIVLENTGRWDAFDVRFQDQIPEGFVFPTSASDMELTVWLGDGTTQLVQTTGYVVTSIDPVSRTFSIELTDQPGQPGQGSINQGKLPDGTLLTDGLNYVVVTYDLRLSADVDSGATLTNTATLTNYTGLEGSDQNRVPEGLTANAFVTTATPVIGKQLISTEFIGANNSNTQAVIGEKITYTVLTTIPEGTTDSARIVDTLDAGLEFVGLTSVVRNGITSIAPTATVSGQAVTFNLGDLVNPNGNNAVDETIAITYEVRVRNVLGNQQGTLLNNSAVFSWQTADQSTGPLASTDHPATVGPVQAANVTVVEPQVNTSKSVSPTAGADAGDLVTYTINFQALGTRPTAFDTVFNDPLPAQLESYVITGVTDSAGVLGIASFQIALGNLLQLVPGTTVDMAPGRLVTVIVQGNVISTINPNQTVTNTARAAWTSLDGDLPLIERTDADGPGPDATVLNNYVSQASVSFNAQNVAIAKAIVSTSETSTAANNLLTIGEIVRYRVTLTVPEGQIQNLQVQDLLPTGLTFLNDGTATYQTNVQGSLTSSDFNTLPGLGVLPGVATPFDDRHVGSSNSPTADPDNFDTGSDIFFKFATVTNADRDNATAEQIIVEFNAIADNSIAGTNDAGDIRNNQARVTSSTSANLGTTPNVASTIVEPNLSVAKTVTDAFDLTTVPPSVLAGGTISFDIVITAGSGANATTAFDVLVQDVVPLEVTNVVATIAGTTGTVVNGSAIAAGNSVTITAGSMTPGSTLTATITGRLIEPILNAGLFTNTANLTYTSLPGSDGTTTNPTGSVVPGAPGNALGERDGSNGVGGIPNDYAGTDSADFQTFVPILAKVFSDTSETGVGDSTERDVQIGEQVTYDLYVQAQDGTVSGLIVTDSLPAGMRLDSWQLLTGAGNATFILNDFNGTVAAPTISLSPPVDGPTTITFTFANFVANVGADGGPDITDNLFAIRLTATVLNVPGNQDGTAITNTASASLLNNAGVRLPVTQVPVDATVDVIEPVLDISKTTTATNIEAGDTVTYTITVQHTAASTASAYDLELIDTLPVQLQNASVISALIGTSNVTGSFGFSGSQLTVVDNAVDLLLGQTLTLTISGQATNSVGPGDTITNTATVTYTSINDAPGTPSTADERNGSGLPDPNALNNYFDSATSVITVPGLLDVEKSIVDPPDARVTIGQELTYHIEVSLIEGTTQNVTLVDNLPAGTVFVPGSVVVPTVPGVVFGTQTETYNPVANTLTISWDSVTIPGSTNSGTGIDTGSFALEYDVRVLNVAANQLGTPLPNTVTATAEAGLTDTDNAQAVIIEPVLEITKTTPATNIEARDTVTYTITVQHTSASTANAYDLEIIDTLPVQLQNASVISAFVGSSNVTGSFGFLGNDLTVVDNAVDLLLGQTLTLTISGVVTNSVGPGDPIDNTATLTYTGINDAPGAQPTPGERNGSGLPDPNALNNYFDSAEVVITVPGFLSVDKSIVDPPNAEVSIGQQLTYRVAVSLIEGTTEDVTLVDTLPPGTVFVPGSLVVPNIPGIVFGTQTQNYDAATNRLTISWDSVTILGLIDSGAGDNLDTRPFLVEYKVLVLDVPANTSGPPPLPATQLPNTITATAETGLTDTDEAVAEVVEPFLTISKSVNDADHIVSVGQTLTYVLTVQHIPFISNSTAYDFVLTDLVPAQLQNVVVTSMMGSGGVTGLTNLSLGNSIRIEADSIPLGGSITIVFTANVSLAAGSGAIIDNNARIYWDSLGDGDGNDLLGTGTLIDVDRDYGARAGFIEEPDPAITDNDLAQDTEQVKVGSLAVGDTVWLDQNRNGVVDAGESGIPNVLVFIDFDRDGTRNLNEPFDITDASGFYEISNLAPGLYSVRVDPATLPPGLLEVFVFDDPRVPGTPLLGGFSTEVLLDATDEERADFGYFLPPLPPVPPTPPGPIFPPTFAGGAVEPPVEPEPEPTFSALDTFFIDVFNSVLGGPSVIEEPLLPFALVGEPSPLPSAAAEFPLLSGAAEPGSNITLTFYSATGELIFSNTILVPSGGNWVASFPAEDTTGNVTVVAQVTANNLTPLSTDNNFNFRANYATSMESFFVSRSLTTDSVFSGLASRRMGVLASADEPIIPGGWNKRNYEFLAASAVPSN